MYLSTSRAALFLAVGLGGTTLACGDDSSSSAAQNGDAGTSASHDATCGSETPAEICAEPASGSCPTGASTAAALTLLCSASRYPGAVHPYDAVDVNLHSITVYSTVETIATYAFAEDDATLVAIEEEDDTGHTSCARLPGSTTPPENTNAVATVHYTYATSCASDGGTRDASADH